MMNILAVQVVEKQFKRQLVQDSEEVISFVGQEWVGQGTTWRALFHRLYKRVWKFEDPVAFKNWDSCLEHLKRYMYYMYNILTKVHDWRVEYSVCKLM